MAPSHEPSTKPTTTSRLVMPACHIRRSVPQMRMASSQTLEKGGSTNSGTPSQPGAYSHSSRNTTRTATLQPAVTSFSLFTYLPTNWLV